MKEATFLKYFERHARFFLGKKVITKTEIVYNLHNGECPFHSGKRITLGELETSYLGKSGSRIVHRWYAETTFVRNMRYDWRIPSTVKAMVKIVKGIKAR